ncbi:divalent-cation tolerance protein CutA [Candidatus Woesearchaeota archaeon]|nr:divalent-cation tolerance protein CutA [Candidatus Woesearchaeota archaeon]
MIMLYITCKNNAEAEKIARHLIGKKLAACANIFPIKSIYRWKGKIVNEKEVVLIAKSMRNKFENIKKEVKAIHSYDVPCIEMLNTKANKDYEKWIKGEIK